MTIGEKIRAVRKQKKISQQKLGKSLGVSQAMIAQYENGVRVPKIETLRRIATALKVPISEFSDAFVEIPEFRTEAYGSTIKDMIYSIEEGPCHISKDSADKLLKDLKDCIIEGENIQDLDKLSDFYWKSELNFSHRILNEILKQYSDQSVYDLVDLLNYFLALSDNAQNKVQEYVLDLYEIPIYRKN